MDVIGGIITGGVAIIAIGIIAYIAGAMFVSLPAFNASIAAEAPWAGVMTSIMTNAGVAFNLLGILPLVLGASIAIAILIGAFVLRR